MYAFVKRILLCLMNTYIYVTMILFHFVKPVSIFLRCVRSDTGCDRHSRCIPWTGAVWRGRTAHGACVKRPGRNSQQELCKNLSSLSPHSLFPIRGVETKMKTCCLSVCTCIQCVSPMPLFQEPTVSCFLICHFKKEKKRNTFAFYMWLDM